MAIDFTINVHRTGILSAVFALSWMAGGCACRQKSAQGTGEYRPAGLNVGIGAPSYSPKDGAGVSGYLRVYKDSTLSGKVVTWCIQGGSMQPCKTKAETPPVQKTKDDYIIEAQAAGGAKTSRNIKVKADYIANVVVKKK